jgi:amidase
VHTKNNRIDETTPSRRSFLKVGMLGGAALAAAPLPERRAEAAPTARSSLTSAQAVPGVQPFELDEISLAALADGMKSGKFTARSLTEKYLARIQEIDQRGPRVNAVIELNPDASSIADELDKERQAQGPRGLLHGIPILIKDNIATRDRMQTTAGSLALVGAAAPKDSFVAKKLRDAGAVILGKTNLSEWANIRSSHSSSGWSARGGQTRNPYALDRNPCGSSSGSGVAVTANLCAVAVGTETDGSIVCPANANGVVGIKPTLGLVSRAGIIPIAHSQDSAGPMARTVTDAAILLGALTGVDPDDPATVAGRGNGLSDYTKFLDPKGLAGARIGVVRKLFGFSEAVDKLMNEAVEAMKRQGAAIVDPADIETLDQMGDAELEVLLYELKADLNGYLAALGPGAPVHSIEEVIAFNEQHREKEMPYFGQDLFIKAQARGSLFRKEYLDALEKSKRLMRTEGIDAVMDKFKLDALVAPTGAPAWLTDLVDGDRDIGGSSTPAAVAGYPNISVPAGFVFGLPVGISFFGRAWSEPTLLKLAYAFEQATQHRRPPRLLPTAELSV